MESKFDMYEVLGALTDVQRYFADQHDAYDATSRHVIYLMMNKLRAAIKTSLEDFQSQCVTSSQENEELFQAAILRFLIILQVPDILAFYSRYE